MTLYELIGKNLRAGRERRAVTQTDLATRIGITRTSISNIESGRQKVTLHTLYKICDELELEPTDVFPFLEEWRSERRKNSLSQIERELPEEAQWIKSLITMSKQDERDDV